MDRPKVRALVVAAITASTLACGLGFSEVPAGWQGLYLNQSGGEIQVQGRSIAVTGRQLEPVATEAGSAVLEYADSRTQSFEYDAGVGSLDGGSLTFNCFKAPGTSCCDDATLTQSGDGSLLLKISDAKDAACAIEMVLVADSPENRSKLDRDRDGIPDIDDCGVSDASLVQRRADDADCDGTPTAVDCAPNDPANSVNKTADQDCDGQADAEDCDPDGSGGFVDDKDCDRVKDAADCAPTDAKDTRSNQNDRDCDSVADDKDCAPESADNATAACQLPFAAKLAELCRSYDASDNPVAQGKFVREGKQLLSSAAVRSARGTVYGMVPIDEDASAVTLTVVVGDDYYFRQDVRRGTAVYGSLEALAGTGACVEFSASGLTIDAMLDRSYLCEAFGGGWTFDTRFSSVKPCAE